MQNDNANTTSRPDAHARSPRYYRRELLRQNRFLGLPNLAWALSITAAVGLALFLSGGGSLDPDAWRWLVAALPLSWALVELLFLPRRLLIHRLARQESRDEVVRVALRHGLNLEQVEVRDD
ncbi:hypothetical protein BWR19_10060 [Halomonas sp. 1513]|nr:hypothetical protein [Halomonas sp. 1513]APX93247.1 hypothetical protein BWR19_10060 [Halomonas sp. 1513]